jgi:hypothetical protein
VDYPAARRFSRAVGALPFRFRIGRDSPAIRAPFPANVSTAAGVLAERAPSVTLIDRGYNVPRSWRASLDWTTSIRNWMIRANTLGSYDLSQPGVIDANFAGVPKLSLSGEGSRPVFVSPAASMPTPVQFPPPRRGVRRSTDASPSA